MRNDGMTLFSVGNRPYRVAIEVRPDGSMRLRTYENGTKERITLPALRVENEQGEARHHDMALAERIALATTHGLRRGRSFREAAEAAMSILHPAETSVAPESSTSLGVISGCFLDDVKDHMRRDSHGDYRRGVRTLVSALGAGLDMNLISVGTVDALTKKLARDFNARIGSNPDTAGVATAVKIASLLYRIAKWAADRRLIAPVSRPHRLADQVRRVWVGVTKSKPPTIVQPVHCDAEGHKIVCGSQRDVRLEHLLKVGGFGARLGQVSDSMRSHLSLQVDAISFGRLVVPDGSTYKRGPVLEFSARIHEAWREAFCTFLRPWEEAFQAGRIRDYHLWPGVPAHKLAFVDPLVPTHRIYEADLGEMWDQMEEAAGVDKVPGRRWYGVRRLFRRLAVEREMDARVLDRLMAHNTRGTGGYYEDREDPWVRARAIEVREEIWLYLCNFKIGGGNG